MFCTLGCLRVNGTCFLRVFFRVITVGSRASIQFISPPTDKYCPHVVVVRNGEEQSPYVRGQLVFDKNADARKPRRFYMPNEIPATGIRPVEVLEEYLLAEPVDTGALLFVAPKGISGWYTGPYRGHGAFKKAYARAFPDAIDLVGDAENYADC
eukprot:gene11395-biopygen11696